MFRGHMLTEMARMSLDDGLVLQIHAGSARNHSRDVMARFGRDKGYDIPTQIDYVAALKPLLNAVGGEALFRVAISPQEHTGLPVECEVQVDRITSIRRHRIVKVIGHASATRMEQVDQALRRWLAL